LGLPHTVLIKRLTNELQRCSGYIGSDITFDPEKAVFPMEITVNMINVPAYAKTDGTMMQISEHSYRLYINEEYPYEKPRVKWETPIFHPNIMPPEDGGYVCIKLLDKWSFGSTLLSFMKALEHLVVNPNASNPFGSEICAESAEFFMNNEARIKASVTFGGL